MRRSGGRAAIDVADRGPGIPEADRETVFDRFVRLEPSRSTPGNGLGLSLVRAVARRHEASVTLGDNHARAQGADRIPGMDPGGLAIDVVFEPRHFMTIVAAIVPGIVDPPGGLDHHVAEALFVEPGAAQHRRHDVVDEQFVEARLIAAAIERPAMVPSLPVKF